MIQRHLVGRGTRHLAGQQDVAQLRQREGLGEIVVHAGREAGFAVAGQRIGGERHHARGFEFLRDLALAQLARGDEAVHDRHLAIHEHHVELLLLERIERLDAVAGMHGIATQALQHLERQRAVDHVVFHQQHREMIEHGFVFRREHGRCRAHFLEGCGLQRLVQGAAQHALAHGLGESAHGRELRRDVQPRCHRPPSSP